MLRVLPEQVASTAPGASVHVPSRVPATAHVLPLPPERTIAIRGHLRSGGAAALIAGPESVCFMSADRAGRRRVRRFAIREILSVEEHRAGRTSELTLVTTGTTVTVIDVDTAHGWTFCREVRAFILASVPKTTRRSRAQ